MCTVIVGASTGTIEPSEQDLSPVSAAGFAWLHLQGSHYLRVKDSAPELDLQTSARLSSFASKKSPAKNQISPSQQPPSSSYSLPY